MWVTQMKANDAFWDNVNVSEGCWYWNGNTVGPYGSHRQDGITMSAHKFSLLDSGREIPKGWHVDHLCRNKGCVKPSHLDACPVAENVNRARPYTLLAYWTAMTHSKNRESKISEASRRCAEMDDWLAARIQALEKDIHAPSMESPDQNRRYTEADLEALRTAA